MKADQPPKVNLDKPENVEAGDTSIEEVVQAEIEKIKVEHPKDFLLVYLI